jgi:hypothetical protein
MEEIRQTLGAALHYILVCVCLCVSGYMPVCVSQVKCPSVCPSYMSVCVSYVMCLSVCVWKTSARLWVQHCIICVCVPGYMYVCVSHIICMSVCPRLYVCLCVPGYMSALCPKLYVCLCVPVHGRRPPDSGCSTTLHI